MRTSSFFKGISLLLVLNLLIKPVWIFFIDRRVQVVVGHEAYGDYFALLNLSIMLLFLADAGITNLLNQKLASGAGIDFSQLLRIKIGMLIVFAAAAFSLAYLSGVQPFTLLTYVIAVQAATSFFIFLRAIVTARQWFATDAWLSVLDKGLMIVLCSGFLYGLFRPISIILLLQLQLLVTLFAVFVAVYLIAKRKMLQGQDAEPVINIFKQLLPFALIMLLMSVHSRLDGFLLHRLTPNGPFQTGLYAGAYRLLDAANMLGYLAASFLLPFVARYQTNQQVVGKTASLMVQYLLSIAAVLVSFTFIYADWVQQLLYHSAMPVFSRLIVLVIFSLPAYYTFHVYGTVLTATAKFRPFILVLCLSVVINFILNLLLIPPQGATGAAIAAIVSQYTGAILLYVFFKKSVAPSSYLEWLRPVLVFVVFLLLFYTSFYYRIHIWLTLLFAAFLFSAYLISQIVYFRKNFSEHA